MAVSMKYLKDENGEIFSPIVSGDAVKFTDGRSMLSVRPTIMLSSPLTPTNLAITDNSISGWKFMHITYTFDINGNKYRGSCVATAGDRAEWYTFEFQGNLGYVMFGGTSITVSQYSHANFAVMSYTPIM